MIFQISKKQTNKQTNKKTNKQTNKQTKKNDKMILSLAWNNMFTDN